MLSDPAAALAAATSRWRDLALKRREHFVDLYRSGRWRHYYTEREFVAELQKLMQVVGRWSSLAQDAAIDRRGPVVPPATDAESTAGLPTHRLSDRAGAL